jgi:hypothetical protein
VPREVSEIVVYFLRLRRPFVNDLQMLYNSIARPTAFLWEPTLEEQWGDESDSERSDDEDSYREDREDADDKKQRVWLANLDGY